MAKLDQRRINFVKRLPIDVKVKTLYEFLKKGTSNRDIERLIDKLKEEDGWQAWSIIHFYGFDKYSKAKYPSLTLKKLKNGMEGLNDDDLEILHLDNGGLENDNPNVIMGNNDGRDIFRTIKTRQGQYKLRKLLLINYQSKCALCDISHPRLLVTSHIKTWAKSSYEERVNPRNAILLCKIHDALFEYGFISFSDDLQVIFSSKFDFWGQKIPKDITFRNPIVDPPSTFFLREHRMKHGYGLFGGY